MKTRSLKLACWNVGTCTVQDSDATDHPQRHSALVARELAQLDIDTSVVSEIHYAEQGSLTEHGAGYTLYWSGKVKVTADYLQWVS